MTTKMSRTIPVATELNVFQNFWGSERLSDIITSLALTLLAGGQWHVQGQ
jgi:hypothetical protein